MALSLYTVFHSFKAGHRNYELTRDTLLIEIWLYFSRKIYVYLFYNFFLNFFWTPSLLQRRIYHTFIHKELKDNKLEAGLQMFVTYHIDCCELIYILFYEI